MKLRKLCLGWVRFPWFQLAWLGPLGLLVASHMMGCGQVGPLAAPGHQSLGCPSCHTGGKGLVRQLPGGSTIMDQACLACHSGHGEHNPQQVAGRTPGCIACHGEHHGKEALTLVPDRLCTICHASIRRKDGRTPGCLNVPDWDRHPEFLPQRLGVAPGPRNFVFSHGTHLRSEGVRGPDGGSQVLKCGTCHQPDEAGRSMKPARYEGNCAGCHRLIVELTGVKDGPAAEVSRRLPARHATVEEVRSDMRQKLVDKIIRVPELLRGQSADDGRWPLREPDPPMQSGRWNWVERQMQEFDRQLFDHGGGCPRCHLETNPRKGLPSYQPTELPVQSLPRAFFNHHAHRQTECWKCHSVASSTSPRDVQTPPIQVCRTCHTGGPLRQPSQVRATCVGCHTYHPPAQKRRELLDRLPR